MVLLWVEVVHILRTRIPDPYLPDHWRAAHISVTSGPLFEGLFCNVINKMRPMHPIYYIWLYNDIGLSRDLGIVGTTMAAIWIWSSRVLLKCIIGFVDPEKFGLPKHISDWSRNWSHELVLAYGYAAFLAPLCHLAAELFKCRLFRRRRRQTLRGGGGG